jgi:hypothetical protein
MANKEKKNKSKQSKRNKSDYKKVKEFLEECEMPLIPFKKAGDWIELNNDFEL